MIIVRLVLAVLGSGVPQVVSRQCCAHLAKEACLLADTNPDSFEALCEFCLEKMQGQVLHRRAGLSTSRLSVEPLPDTHSIWSAPFGGIGMLLL